jgi:RNA polymerase sigma-70 factor (ECF subfamily)
MGNRGSARDRARLVAGARRCSAPAAAGQYWFVTPRRRRAEPSLEDLLARYRATRDPGVLGLAFDRAAPGLFRLALAWTPDAASAEDAVQETFLAAFEGIDGWDAARPAGPWLAGILRHKAARARRRAHRNPEPLAVVPPSLAPGPASSAELREETERLRAAIARLPEPYRSVALLRWRHGLAPAEIADVRGEPPGTVRSTLTRALARLRRDLGGLAVFAVLPRATADRAARGLSRVRRDTLRLLTARLAAATAGAFVLGGLVMATKKQIVLSSCAVALLAAGWAGHTCSGDPAASSPATRHALPDSSRGTAATQARPDAAVPPPPPQEAPPAPAGDVVRGRVVDRAGDPVPGARVAAFPDSIERAVDPAAERGVATGADGAFAVGGLRGPAPYVIAVQAHGFAPRTRTGVRPPGDLTIVLGSPADFEGRVLGPDDAPIAGARVRVSGVLAGGARFDASATSASDGAFAVTGLPPLERRHTSPLGSLSVEARAEGFAPLLVADVLDVGPQSVPDLAEGRTTHLDLHMVRGAVVTGRVIDENDRPVEGARVALMSYERPLGFGRFAEQPRHLGTTTSAADGTFRIANVPAAGVHRPAILGEILPFGALVAVGPGGRSGSVTIPVLRDGESHKVELALLPVASVTGRVVDQAGAAVANAAVSVRTDSARQPPTTFRDIDGMDVPCPFTTSGPDGRFRAGVPLSADAGGKLHVGAASAADGMRPYRSGDNVVANDASGTTDAGDVVIRADAPGIHADVVVVGADGRPVAGAAFRTRDELHISGSAWGWPATDADGRSRLGWLQRSKDEVPAGAVPREVVVTAPGLAAAVVTVTFDAADRDPQRIELAPGRHVAGRVRWSDGSPAADAWILVADAAVPLAEAVPPADSQRAPPDRHAATPGLVILGRAHAEADGSFRVDDLPDRPCHVVARVEAMDGTGGRLTESARASLSEVRPGAEDLVLVLPPSSESRDAAGKPLDVRVLDDATGRPLAGAGVELFDGTTILYGVPAGEGRVRFDAVPRGEWTLRAGSARFGRAIVSGVRAESGEREVRVARGAAVRGRLQDAGGPGLVHLVAEGAALPWFWSPATLLSADGTFSFEGVPAGRYRVAVTRNASAARAVTCDETLEVRTGDTEVQYASRVPPPVR